MIHTTIPIQMEGSADYARLTTYLWDHSEEIPIDARPLILICPGGGYHLTTDREGEAVALRLMSMGYHTAVLRYSVSPVRWPVALTELACSVALLRSRAGEWRIDPEKIVVMGFSAGGHLAASYGVFWDRPFLAEAAGCGSEALRPGGLLLGYPVITSDPAHWHAGSLGHLLGSDPSPDLLEQVSLEKHVGPQVPRTFLWNTYADDTVPPENSLLFAHALLSHRVPVEYHLYEKGGHGLSLANTLTDNQAHQCYQAECQSWVGLAQTWLNNL